MSRRRKWGTGGPSPKLVRRDNRILNQAHRNYTGRRRGECAVTVLAVIGATAAAVSFAATAKGLL